MDFSDPKILNALILWAGTAQPSTGYSALLYDVLRYIRDRLPTDDDVIDKAIEAVKTNRGGLRDKLQRVLEIAPR